MGLIFAEDWMFWVTRNVIVQCTIVNNVEQTLLVLWMQYVHFA